MVLESTVVRVESHFVILRTASSEERIAIDAILALIGGEPGRGLLEACGLTVEGT
jgi:hypothetical protein